MDSYKNFCVYFTYLFAEKLPLCRFTWNFAWGVVSPT